jgi:hypothetical protein
MMPENRPGLSPDVGYVQLTVNTLAIPQNTVIQRSAATKDL